MRRDELVNEVWPDRQFCEGATTSMYATTTRRESGLTLPGEVEERGHLFSSRHLHVGCPQIIEERVNHCCKREAERVQFE